MLDLGRTFLQSVERSPRQVAIVDDGLRLSYGDWAGRIGAVQRGLSEAGLARGDHLLVVLQNRWEMATLHWACQFAGIVMTPLFVFVREIPKSPVGKVLRRKLVAGKHTPLQAGGNRSAQVQPHHARP
ncbi:MAG: AMP-binding protein [Burkholderiaceae bacterium]|nr:AMP-binding protein [Burkholderiaceae bacterium]